VSLLQDLGIPFPHGYVTSPFDYDAAQGVWHTTGAILNVPAMVVVAAMTIVLLAIVLDRSADSLCGFVDSAITPGTQIITDDWSGYASLDTRGYKHLAVAEGGAIPRWPRSHPLHPLSLLAEAHFREALDDLVVAGGDAV
jgi:ISXO2-like transposase domain